MKARRIEGESSIKISIRGGQSTKIKPLKEVTPAVFNITIYDDDVSLLEKYSDQVEGSLPSFFRIVSRTNEEIELEDVRSLLKDITPRKLSDARFFEPLIANYPRISKKELCYLWIMTNSIKLTIPDLYELQKIDRYGFITIKKAEEAVIEFKKSIEKQRKSIHTVLTKERTVFESLGKIDTVPTSDFHLEEITSSIVVSLPNKESLLEVFDAMDASAELPFILISYRGNVYYKVYSAINAIIPPVEWIKFVPVVDGIYFKVSNIKGRASSKTLIENIYSTGVWFPDNRVEITFMTSFDNSESTVIKRIFSSLNDRIKHEIITERQLGIKGTFLVPDVNFNKVIFADLIATDETFKYFIFANERDTSSSTSNIFKTLTTRKRFYFYYSPNQNYNIGASLAISIIPTAGGNIVRVIRALNIQQAMAVKNVLAKLFGIYNSKRKEIAEFYSQFVSFIDEGTKAVKQKKRDKKTGLRAAALESYDPDMFRARYPDQCQREKQPYIIHTKEEALKKAKELGDPHKVMPFGDVWYACDPREPDDKNDRHTWPGLKLNTSDTGNKEFDSQYIREVPLFPCCYTQDQYKKKASQWRKYLESGGRFVQETKEKEAGVGHIVKGRNLAGYGRYGEIPFNWEKLLKYLKIEKVLKGKQDVYPLLRKGVAPSPDSFIHCLESALNSELYDQIPTIEEKQAYVMGIREKIADSKDALLNIGSQELYDRTIDEIRESLTNEDEYIAPERYISIMQAYYGCNIFMYVVDESDPSGDILLPQSSGVYLTRDMNEYLKTVLIIKYESEVPDYPYQCELMVLVDVRDKKFDKVTTFFKNHPISQLAMKLYYDSNDIFIVSPEGYDIYRPVPEEM